MKKYFYIVLMLYFISCHKNKTILNRYDHGNIESIHYYGNDEEIDSTYLYYNTNKIKQIIYFRKGDSLNFTVLFDENGYKFASGNFHKRDLDFRIGKWYFNQPKVDSIVEYINVNNKSYTNQIWVRDKKSKDTLQGRGNYYIIYIKDTISVSDTLKARFYLFQPLYSYSSEMHVIMPTNEKELKKDFSNIYEIEKDTIPSLKNDGIPHPEIPKDIPQNHNANAGLIYPDSGEKRMRGYIAEYIISRTDKDTTRTERRLYFENTIFVKDR